MRNLIKWFVILGATAGLYVFARIEGSVVASALFWSMAVLVLYWTLFLVYPLLRVRLERRLVTHRHETGQTLRVELSLARRFWYPVGLIRLEDLLPRGLSDGETVKAADARARFRRTEVIPYSVEHIKRGIHEWEYCLVRVQDVFGLFERRRRVRLLTTVEVNPLAFPVDLPRDDRTGGDGERYRRRRTFREATTTIGGVREYAAGDRLGRIDWKSSARRDQLMSKVFDPERQKKLSLIYVPMLERANEEWFERSLSLLLGAIRELERRKMPFELYVAGESLTVYHLPEQLPEVGHYLLTATPVRGGRIVEGFRHVVDGQDLLVVTPTETEWVRELMRETEGNYYLYTASGVTG